MGAAAVIKWKVLAALDKLIDEAHAKEGSEREIRLATLMDVKRIILNIEADGWVGDL